MSKYNNTTKRKYNNNIHEQINKRNKNNTTNKSDALTFLQQLPPIIYKSIINPFIEQTLNNNIFNSNQFYSHLSLAKKKYYQWDSDINKDILRHVIEFVLDDYLHYDIGSLFCLNKLYNIIMRLNPTIWNKRFNRKLNKSMIQRIFKIPNYLNSTQWLMAHYTLFIEREDLMFDKLGIFNSLLKCLKKQTVQTITIIIVRKYSTQSDLERSSSSDSDSINQIEQLNNYFQSFINLKELVLEFSYTINVSMDFLLILKIPNLTKLSIESVAETMKYKDKEIDKIFKQCNKLQSLKTELKYYSHSILKKIINSCNWKYINLRNFDTDAICHINGIAQLNSLKTLKLSRLSGSYNIESILQIIPNNLTELEISTCGWNQLNILNYNNNNLRFNNIEKLLLNNFELKKDGPLSMIFPNLKSLSLITLGTLQQNEALDLYSLHILKELKYLEIDNVSEDIVYSKIVNNNIVYNDIHINDLTDEDASDSDTIRRNQHPRPKKYIDVKLPNTYEILDFFEKCKFVMTN